MRGWSRRAIETAVSDIPAISATSFIVDCFVSIVLAQSYPQGRVLIHISFLSCTVCFSAKPAYHGKIICQEKNSLPCNPSVIGGDSSCEGSAWAIERSLRRRTSLDPTIETLPAKQGILKAGNPKALWSNVRSCHNRVNNPYQTYSRKWIQGGKGSDKTCSLLILSLNLSLNLNLSPSC